MNGKVERMAIWGDAMQVGGGLVFAYPLENNNCCETEKG
jgi:hypothetical protein